MIQAVKGNSEERHEEQAPLFVCCSGCQAVLKAGCKTCKVCGLHRSGPPSGPVVKEERDTRMSEGANASDEEDVRSDSSALGSGGEASSEDETVNAERVEKGKEAGTSGRVEKERAKVQAQEQTDLPPFDCKTDKPMMEMEAGSNVWYQAAILRETSNEIRVLFPDPEEGDLVTKEWVKKTSSRIWRGSLAKHVWKYLSKGAWAPKKNPKHGRQRRSGYAQKHAAQKQKAQGEVTDGTGTGASMDLDSAAEEEQATHMEEEQQRPKSGRKRKRAAAAAADGGAAAAQDGEEGGATHSNSGVPDTGGFGFNDGVGLSSRDEAQAPQGEAELLDPLAAWFQVHFALLEERGTLVTQLEGAGPEVGVAPQHALPTHRPSRPAETTRRKHSRNYDVNEGRCTYDANAKDGPNVVVGSDWQPSRNGGAHVTTGTGIDKSPPYKMFERESDGAGNAQPQPRHAAAAPTQRPAKASGSRGAQQGRIGQVTPEVSAAGSDSEQPRHKQHGASRGSRELHVRAGNKDASILSQEGIWVGLEWDDASRGKHNGSYKEKDYFSCLGNRASGSFVRQNKLLAVADLGIALTEALAERYLQDAQKEAREGSDQEMYVQTASRRRVQVQLLGEEQIRDHQACLEVATQATLDGARVSSIGSSGDLHNTAPRLQELSLEANLLPSWKEVSRLAEELPSLRSLDLSWNRMAFPLAPCDSPVFAALRLLVLNFCCLLWEQVKNIEKALPVLEELCLCGNGIDHLESSIEGFSKLRVLDLSNNAIQHWDAVRPLSQLPSLRCVSLNDNQVASIQVDSTPGNPLISSSKEERFEVIARLPHLANLNASDITPYERKESELRYMRAILGELSDLSSNQDAQARLRAMHPRLTELQAKYGDTGAPAIAASAPKALASNMLQLSLTCTADCAGNPTSVTKKLPNNMSLRKVKQLCERLFKLPAHQQALAARGPDGDPRSLGKDDESVLGSLNLQDGAELLVMELDVRAAEQEAAEQHAALTAQHELRLCHQTKGMEILKALRDEQLIGTST
ncbi:hypothetical protein WJX75_009791 [Coccomyxa subellipsoidea]|uniref:CAP-Gly domain-containing protein n=1 Tax=Coccomyxa subellipsoidea TaxID=248742 RepID=A0ABR2Z4X0_9CHLO